MNLNIIEAISLSELKEMLRGFSCSEDGEPRHLHMSVIDTDVVCELLAWSLCWNWKLRSKKTKEALIMRGKLAAVVALLSKKIGIEVVGAGSFVPHVKWEHLNVSEERIKISFFVEKGNRRLEVCFFIEEESRYSPMFSLGVDEKDGETWVAHSSYGPALRGNRYFWPVYEAMQSIFYAGRFLKKSL